jgi:hypothetical protein
MCFLPRQPGFNTSSRCVLFCYGLVRLSSGAPVICTRPHQHWTFLSYDWLAGDFCNYSESVSRWVPRHTPGPYIWQPLAQKEPTQRCFFVKSHPRFTRPTPTCWNSIKKFPSCMQRVFYYERVRCCLIYHTSRKCRPSGVRCVHKKLTLLWKVIILWNSTRVTTNIIDT